MNNENTKGTRVSNGRGENEPDNLTSDLSFRYLSMWIHPNGLRWRWRWEGRKNAVKGWGFDNKNPVKLQRAGKILCANVCNKTQPVITHSKSNTLLKPYQSKGKEDT